MQYDLTAVKSTEDELVFEKAYGIVPLCVDYPGPSVEQGYVYDASTEEGLRVNGLLGNWEGNARIVNDTAYLGKTQRAVQFMKYDRDPYDVMDTAGIYMRSPYGLGNVYSSRFWMINQGIVSFEIQAYYYNNADMTEYLIHPHVVFPNHELFGLPWEMWIKRSPASNHGWSLHFEHEHDYPASPFHIDKYVRYFRGDWAKITIEKTFGRIYVKIEPNYYEGNINEFDLTYWEYDTTVNPGLGEYFEVVPYYDENFEGQWLKIRNLTIVNFDYVGQIGKPLPE